MDSKEIVPLVLVLVGFAFMAWAYVSPPTTRGQHGIIRTVCAAFVGFAATFFLGTAEFQLVQDLPRGGKLLFSGALGFAVFGFVWFTFPKFDAPLPPDSLDVSFDEDQKFEHAARSIVQSEGKSVDCSLLTPEERSAALRATTLAVDTTQDALQQLRHHTKTPVQPYSVDLEQGVYRLRPRS